MNDQNDETKTFNRIADRVESFTMRLLDFAATREDKRMAFLKELASSNDDSMKVLLAHELECHRLDTIAAGDESVRAVQLLTSFGAGVVRIGEKVLAEPVVKEVLRYQMVERPQDRYLTLKQREDAEEARAKAESDARVAKYDAERKLSEARFDKEFGPEVRADKNGAGESAHA